MAGQAYPLQGIAKGNLCLEPAQNLICGITRKKQHGVAAADKHRLHVACSLWGACDAQARQCTCGTGKQAPQTCWPCKLVWP